MRQIRSWLRTSDFLHRFSLIVIAQKVFLYIALKLQASQPALHPMLIRCCASGWQFRSHLGVKATRK